MTDKPLGFFEGTEMPTTGWWEVLWPDPASVLAKVGVKSGMDVIDWLTCHPTIMASCLSASERAPYSQ